jgi:hypothetical protein
MTTRENELFFAIFLKRNFFQKVSILYFRLFVLFEMPSRLDSVFILIVSQKVAKCKHFIFQKGMTIFQREEEL